MWLFWGGIVAPGGCVVAPGGQCAWLLWGGMRGCSRGGMHGCSRGHVWDTTRYRDTVNERAVRILLECILVISKVLVEQYLLLEHFRLIFGAVFSTCQMAQKLHDDNAVRT